MPEITATLVKQLRDMTGAGMMDAKRALQEVGGDIDDAVTYLRQKGMAAAAKRADRATAEGEVVATVSGGLGALAAVGCETEPVSKNEEFLAFAEKVLETVEAGESVDALEEERTQLVGKIGENVQIVGTARMEAGAGELLAAYVHPPANRIGVLVRVRGDDAVAARQLAMHISFAAPLYALREQVPAEAVERERSILAQQEDVASKPEQVREKIVEGRLAKWYADSVLADQTWIIDTSGKTTVAQALQQAGLEVLDFKRLALG